MALASASERSTSRRADSRAFDPVPTVAAAAAALATLVAVLVAHGLLPGYVNNAATAYGVEGAMQCLHDIGRYALTTNCHAFGNPLGSPQVSNGPVVFAGALLMRLPGVGPAGAYVATGAIVDALALWGGYALGRRLGLGRAIALAAGALYLIAPTVVGLQGFAGTFSGFALLPAYAALDLWMLERLARRRDRRLAVVLAIYAAVRVLALFLDGYSFVVSGLVTVCLWAAWAWRGELPHRVRWSGIGVIAAANVLALLLYTAYVPGSYADNPIGVFRAMGLDVVTLGAPTSAEWFPNLLGLTSDHSDLWGDGTNSAYNYAGPFCVLLAAVGLALRPRPRYGVALAGAGVVALLLALGPSLKVGDVRPTGLNPLAYQSYLMPSSAADASLPWAWLYTHVPGLEDMRATYRWFGLTRLALVLLAGLGVQRLLRRNRVLGVLAACLIFAELLPNFPLLTRSYRAHHEQMQALTTSVVGQLRALTNPHERAFFLSYDGSHNDYLVNYLAPAAELQAYNAGGDKNVALAAARWPPAIAALARPDVNADAVYGALSSGAADVVVAPYFHMRLNAYVWPPTAQQRAAAATAFAPILRDPRFAVAKRPWVAVIRLAR